MLGLSVGNVAGLTSVGELLLDLDVCALMQDCGEEEHRAEGRNPMALNTKKQKKKKQFSRLCTPPTDDADPAACCQVNRLLWAARRALAA
jgi:hypothetical protein